MFRRARALLGRAAQVMAVACAAMLPAACSTGAYPIDVFPEMHYQPSQRALEPQRLTPPDGAVPRSGAPPTLTFAQARDLVSPVARTPESGLRARQVYAVNCAACHGAQGDGQGPLAPYFARSPAGVVPPVDLAAPRVQGRTDGELWWIIRQGLGNMPPYRHLLGDDEIWLMVQMVRDVGGP